MSNQAAGWADVVGNSATREFVTCVADTDERIQTPESPVTVHSDVLIFEGGRVLLGHRRRNPQQNWWVFGGSMRAGETYGSAVQRTVQRQIGITLDPERLSHSPLGFYGHMWYTEVNSFTTLVHRLSVLNTYSAEPDEFGSFGLNVEFARACWHDVQRILQHPTDFHPALVRMVFDFSQQGQS